MAIVHIVAGSDQRILSLIAKVHSYAKRAVFAGTATGADAVAVAVEDVRCPVALDRPIAQGTLEVFEGRKSVAFVDHRHFGRTRVATWGQGIRGGRRLASGAVDDTRGRSPPVYPEPQHLGLERYAVALKPKQPHKIPEEVATGPSLTSIFFAWCQRTMASREVAVAMLSSSPKYGLA